MKLFNYLLSLLMSAMFLSGTMFFAEGDGSDTQDGFQNDGNDGNDGNEEGSDGGDGNSGGDDQDDYFLTVNERQRYRTPEQAIQAYKEAGQRIAQLSGWEREMGRLNIRDPRHAALLLEEALQARQARAKNQQGGEGGANGAGNGNAAGGSSTHVADSTKLTQEEREAMAWIEKVAPNLGLIKKSDIMPMVEALQKEVAELKGGVDESRGQAFEARVESAQTMLGTSLKAAGLPDDPEFSGFAENALRAWIDADEGRVRAFYGDKETLKQLIADGVEYLKTGLKGFDVKKLATGKPGVNGVNQVSYQRNKNRAMANNRRLPQQGAGRANASGGGEKPKPKIDADTHNRAWEVLQARLNGGNAAE